jgi:hypothetical protein
MNNRAVSQTTGQTGRTKAPCKKKGEKNDQPNNQRSVRKREKPTNTLHLPNQPIEMQGTNKSNQASTKATKHSRLFLTHHKSLSSPHVLGSKGKLWCPFNVTQPTGRLSCYAVQRNIIILKTNTINSTQTSINSIVHIHLIFLTCFGLPRPSSKKTKCEVENYKQLNTQFVC